MRVSGSPHSQGAISLDTQREYIAHAAKLNGWEIVSEFVDTAPSRVPIGKRIEGAKALSMCKRLGTPLVVAQLGRLSRSAHHIAELTKELELKVATMSQATAHELFLYATLVEQERRFILSQEAQPVPKMFEGPMLDSSFLEEFPHYAALQIGRTPENRQLAAAAVSNRVKAFQSEVLPHIQACLDTGLTTLTDVANCLNKKGIKTSREGEWSATQVKRLMKGLNLSF